MRVLDTYSLKEDICSSALKVRKMILFLLVQQRRDDLAERKMEIKVFSRNRKEIFF